jgi:hypothetical protein
MSQLLEKIKWKQKNEMLLRHVTISLSLINYLPLSEIYAKGYNGAKNLLFV